MCRMRCFEFALAMSIACVLLADTALAQFPPSISAAQFDGRNGFTIQGTVYNQFADRVAGLGDVNADGIDDFASGASGLLAYPDCYCEPSIGMVQVFFGRRDIGRSGFWTVADLAEVESFRIPEVGVGTAYGSVSPAGDFNDDGIADFMIGAAATHHGTHGYAGACHVVYGRPGLGAAGSFDLASLNGSNGFTVFGGFTLAGIGATNAAIRDFNADGMDDIMLSSIRAGSFTGQCYVIYGGTDIGASGEFSLADLGPETGIVINGIAPGYVTGKAKASAGDINGDGYWDILIGSSKREELGERGEAYVVFGGPNVAPGGVIELSELNGENGFIIRAAGVSLGGSGSSVAGFGDINGDGFDDVAMSERDALLSYWVDVVFGGPNVGASGEFDASTLDGTNGFRILGRPTALPTIYDPEWVGDLNSDGFNDVGVVKNGSHIWVIYGRPDVGSTGAVHVPDATGQTMFQADTSDAVITFRGMGDINDDGIDDLASGVRYGVHFPTGADLGRVEVFFGRQMGDVDLDADIDLADFQYWTTCMAGPTDGVAMITGCQVFDFDRDGQVDLADFAGFQSAFEE